MTHLPRTLEVLIDKEWAIINGPIIFLTMLGFFNSARILGTTAYGMLVKKETLKCVSRKTALMGVGILGDFALSWVAETIADRVIPVYKPKHKKKKINE